MKVELPDDKCLEWGISPGTAVEVTDTPEGLLIRPSETPLRKIYVEPTSYCNLRCRTCVRTSWEEPTGYMDTETYGALLEDLEAESSLMTMAFWGFGEPLMHPKILEMLALAKELGIETELVTNGVLLERDMAEGLVMAGLNRLVVSIDGITPESYQEVRPGADFHAVKENLRGLIKVRGKHLQQNPEIGIEFVLTRRNVRDLVGLKELARELCASFIIVTNVLPYAEDHRDEILYRMSGVSSKASPRSKWIPEVLLAKMDVEWEYMESVFPMLVQGESVSSMPSHYFARDDRCPFVWEGAAAVSWDGAVSPCIPLTHSYKCYVLGREKQIRKYSVGNVRDESLPDIWRSKEYADFRKRVLRFDFAPCVYCGNCFLADSNEEDCFETPFPVCGDCLWSKGIILCP